VLTVVSFWTNETFRRYAARLAESCDRYGLEHDIAQLPDLGDQNKNVHQKAPFIRRMLVARPDSDILWIDADAVVCAPCGDMFTRYPCDMAAYLHTVYPTAWRPTSRWGQAIGLLCGGTLYFKQGPAARDVLARWTAVDAARPDRLDQENLLYLLEGVPGLGFLALPPEYCWIEPMARPLYPHARPVIWHLGANVVRVAGAADPAPKVAGKWDYSAAAAPAAYGAPDTYRLAAAWLDGCGSVVEDWGCGTAYARQFFTQSRYVGVDGSTSKFADTVADLLTYISPGADGILLRHVLEHNPQWEALLARALGAARRRVAVVLYIPPEQDTREVARWGDIPCYALGRPALVALLAPHQWREVRIKCATPPFNVEHIFYIEKQ